MSDFYEGLSTFSVAVSFSAAMTGCLYAIINSANEGLQTGFRARCAADCIKLGDSIKNHRWVYSDVNLDPTGIAKLVAGRRNLNLLERKTKEYEDSFIN